MKKYVKVSMMLLLSLFIIAGCNSKNDNEESKKDNPQEENTNNQDENDSESSNEVLGLGDTGTLETVISSYEVTPTALEIAENMDGILPENEGRVFILIDVIIKNTGDSIIEAKELTSTGAVLLNEDERKSNILTHHSLESDYDGFVNKITEDLNPGEEVEGQLLYALPPSDYYDLVYGYALSTTSNEVTWRFDADEAK